MSNEHKIGKITCERLGIKDNLIIKKAEEFLRLFQSKGSVVKSLNETAKIILCLDLAATSVGSSFDQETAVKLSGLKKSAYQNNLHTIEKVLNLDKPLTVSELCVQFGDTCVKDLAEEILKKYMSNNVKAKDVGHPQYIAAAVYTACRLKNLKVQKSQLTSISHLKPSQWKELTDEFNKFITLHGIGSPRKKSKTKLNEADDIIETNDNQIEVGEIPKENEIEPYEVWKKRILYEAYAVLQKEENMQE